MGDRYYPSWWWQREDPNGWERSHPDFDEDRHNMPIRTGLVLDVDEPRIDTDWDQDV